MEKNILNSPIPIKESELHVKPFSQGEYQAQMALLVNTNKYLGKKQHQF